MYRVNNSFGLRTAFASVFPDLCKGDYLNQIKSTEEIKMKEIWKPIKNYEGLYEISNFGRVKSLSKQWIANNGALHIRKERILKQSISNAGYSYVSLCKNQKHKNHTIHHLVFDEFGNMKRNGRVLQVDHIDNDKLNNRIDNLQLLTARQNVSKRTAKTSSKYTGVSWNKLDERWIAYITINGAKIHLGYFDDEEEASAAYQRALIGDLPPKRIYSSKYRGVYFIKSRNKWRSTIYINKKQHSLGYFDSEYDAHLAYQKALKEKI